jgi:hypothetical protein
MPKSSKFVGTTVACLLAMRKRCPSLADPINLLREFGPIGGVGYNVANPNR